MSTNPLFLSDDGILLPSIGMISDGIFFLYDYNSMMDSASNNGGF